VDVLHLRNKILAVGGVPSLILALICVLGAITGAPVLAVVALLGLLPGLGLAVVVASRADLRVARLVDRAASLVVEPGAGSRPEVAATDPLEALAGMLELAAARIDELRAPPVDPDEWSTGEIVAALAERSRSLMDQQLAHIDWLEATEQDPERLKQLFELDHLAYQARRSTESMVIAGGGAPTPYSGGPTPITDILRVAIGAVEAYRAVRLVAVDDVLIAGQPGYELAQLVAELVDNATRFSADDQTVEVLATGLDNGDYQITVVDHGVGMEPFLLDTTNRVVADPPALDASVGDAIGLVVVGRLARRIGASIELSSTPGSGVTAQIVVPSLVIVADVPGRPSVTSEARTAKRERRRRGLRRRSSTSQSSSRNDEPTPPTGRPDGSAPGSSSMPENVARLLGRSSNRSRTSNEAIPTGEAVDVGADQPRDPSEVGNRAGHGTAVGTSAGPASGSGRWIPPAPAEPAGPANLGLVRRTRGANRGPITTGRRSHVSNRHPDEIRSMITRYRDGLKGKVSADRAEEGAAAGSDRLDGEEAHR
jgi:signal transduction histidine kinase